MRNVKSAGLGTSILLLLVFLFILVSPINALACPAHDEPVSHKQPDGKVITIRKMGDEYFNYYADGNYNPLLEDEKGFFRYVVSGSGGEMKLGDIVSDDTQKRIRELSVLEENPDFKKEYWSLKKSIEEKIAKENDFLEDASPNRDSKKELLNNEERSVERSENEMMYSNLSDKDVLSGELDTLAFEPFEPHVANLEVQALPSKIPLLILRITFNNVPSTSADSAWSSRVFSSSTGASAFFAETSNGKIALSKAYETQGTANDGVIHIKINEPYPNKGRLDETKNFDGYRKGAAAIKKALQTANSTINFAQYDKNGDKVIDSTELIIYAVFSGLELSVSNNKVGIWAHRWSLDGAGVKAPILDGVKVSQYAVSGERINSSNLAAISTICHEVGHILGLPDLYNTVKETTTTFNVDRLSLMANSWGARKNIPGAALPQHLDPWSKIKLGFSSPIVVSGSKSYTLSKSSDMKANSIVKIPTQKASEYYLVENRQYTGFDAAMYGNWSTNGGSPFDLYKDPSGNATVGGIVVWRIDENIIKSQSHINGPGHAPGIMPVYVGGSKNVPFREPGKNGKIFNYALNDYADKYATSLFDKQLTVSSKGSSASITVGVKAGKAIPAKRLSGKTRYETAVAISKEGWTSSKNVILASGVNFPDGLAAAPLAKKLGAPILLADQTNKLPQATENEIKRLGATTVHIIGGTPAISAAVEKSLKSSGKTIKRYAGATRYETAQKIANSLASYDTVIVADSTNFPDALSASAGAGYKGFPILYVTKDSVPPATQSIINKSTVKKVIIIGSTNVVSAKVSDKIKASGKTVTRLQGATRYETNIAVQKHFFPNTSSVGYVATGEDFPDALGAGAAAAKVGAPLILTPNTLTGYPSATKQFIKDKGLNSLKVAGSTAVVSNRTLRYMQTVM